MVEGAGNDGIQQQPLRSGTLRRQSSRRHGHTPADGKSAAFPAALL